MSREYGTFFMPRENNPRFASLNNAANTYASAIRARSSVGWGEPDAIGGHLFDGEIAAQDVLTRTFVEIGICAPGEASRRILNFRRLIRAGAI